MGGHSCRPSTRRSPRCGSERLVTIFRLVDRVPGGTFDATVELQPGNHALIRLIPSPDEAPYVMKEMARPLTAARRDLRALH